MYNALLGLMRTFANMAPSKAVNVKLARLINDKYVL